MKRHRTISEFGWRNLRRHLRIDHSNVDVHDKFSKLNSNHYLSLWMRPEGVKLSEALNSFRGMDYEE